ncbi:hypothetical protein EDB82DRAFT_323418 [Fusarium venenatum]|uniref:uncharacterized protein n=1 Tax=Fusarium venenatum TaxID=56646 RepID=UPI001D8B68B5|nr:hypothetical protein EDB82DRAFT_323418 [Fusarium venenatum]
MKKHGLFILHLSLGSTRMWAIRCWHSNHVPVPSRIYRSTCWRPSHAMTIGPVGLRQALFNDFLFSDASYGISINLPACLYQLYGCSG